jgi:hypothetical protein
MRKCFIELGLRYIAEVQQYLAQPLVLNFLLSQRKLKAGLVKIRFFAKNLTYLFPLSQFKSSLTCCQKRSCDSFSARINNPCFKPKQRNPARNIDGQSHSVTNYLLGMSDVRQHSFLTRKCFFSKNLNPVSEHLSLFEYSFLLHFSAQILRFPFIHTSQTVECPIKMSTFSHLQVQTSKKSTASSSITLFRQYSRQISDNLFMKANTLSARIYPHQRGPEFPTNMLTLTSQMYERRSELLAAPSRVEGQSED